MVLVWPVWKARNAHTKTGSCSPARLVVTHHRLCVRYRFAKRAPSSTSVRSRR
nr:MAG TPA: hypothetical protein [Caudoviricetes sp.]